MNNNNGIRKNQCIGKMEWLMMFRLQNGGNCKNAIEIACHSV